MARLTKPDIERRLLTGASVPWQDANDKNCQLVLGDPKERRLFAFLLGTKVREPTGLSQGKPLPDLNQFVDRSIVNEVLKEMGRKPGAR